jgi:hypothetical protein
VVDLKFSLNLGCFFLQGSYCVIKRHLREGRIFVRVHSNDCTRQVSYNLRGLEPKILRTPVVHFLSERGHDLVNLSAGFARAVQHEYNCIGPVCINPVVRFCNGPVRTVAEWVPELKLGPSVNDIVSWKSSGIVLRQPREILHNNARSPLISSGFDSAGLRVV